MGSPVRVETSACHSACCFAGTTRPEKTARIQVSTSRAVATAPPAACAQEVLSPRMSRPTMGSFQLSAQSGGWYSAQAVSSK